MVVLMKEEGSGGDEGGQRSFSPCSVGGCRNQEEKAEVQGRGRNKRGVVIYI